MSSSKIVAADAKDEFWAVVDDCLREFHGMKPEGRRRKTSKLRNAVERMTTAQAELFYHSEPFDVACDIAGEPLKVDEHLDRYLQIRDGKPGKGIATGNGHHRRKSTIKR